MTSTKLKPSDIYTHITRDELFTELQKRGLKPVAFRVPAEGELIVGACVTPLNIDRQIFRAGWCYGMFIPRLILAKVKK